MPIHLNKILKHDYAGSERTNFYMIMGNTMRKNEKEEKQEKEKDIKNC